MYNDAEDDHTDPFEQKSVEVLDADDILETLDDDPLVLAVPSPLEANPNEPTTRRSEGETMNEDAVSKPPQSAPSLLNDGAKNAEAATPAPLRVVPPPALTTQTVSSGSVPPTAPSGSGASKTRLRLVAPLPVTARITSPLAQGAPSIPHLGGIAPSPICTPNNVTAPPLPLPNKAKRTEATTHATQGGGGGGSSTTPSTIWSGLPTESPLPIPDDVPRFHSHPQLQKLQLPSLAPPPMYPLSVTLEQRYELKKCIGEGTYGEVHIGVDKRDYTRKVAVKRLKCIAALEGFPLTSLRELSVHRHLKETLSDADKQYFSLIEDVLMGSNFKDVYMIFDFVKHSLAGLGMRRFVFQAQDIAYIIRSVAVGLQTLHLCKIMHRDIKPNNVLVTEDGQVKLCDFGLALPTGSERNYLTPRLIALAYRPPEMLLGCTTYTTAVDVWSLGCLTTQLFLGVPPFHDRDRTGEMEQLSRMTAVLGSVHQLRPETRRVCNAFNQIAHDTPVVRPQPAMFQNWFHEQLRQVPRARRVECPESAVSLIASCLRFEPSERPSIQEVLTKFKFLRFHDIGRVRENLAGRLQQYPVSHDTLVKREREEAKQRQQQQQQQQGL